MGESGEEGRGGGRRHFLSQHDCPRVHSENILGTKPIFYRHHQRYFVLFVTNKPSQELPRVPEPALIDCVLVIGLQLLLSTLGPPVLDLEEDGEHAHKNHIEQGARDASVQTGLVRRLVLVPAVPRRQ